MKKFLSKVSSTFLSLLFPFLLGAASHSQAATYSKADTTTLNKSTDWVGASSALGVSDIGVFDSTLSAANAAKLTMTSGATFQGLTFTGSMNGPVTILQGFNLFLSGTGIVDMSAANHDVTINCNTLAATNINLAEGRTLTFAGGGVGFLSGTSMGLGSLVFTGTAARTFGVGANPTVNIGNPSTGVGGLIIGSNATLAATSNQINLGRNGAGLMKMETDSGLYLLHQLVIGRGVNADAKMLLSSGTITALNGSSATPLIVGGDLRTGTAVLDVQGGAITLGNGGIAMGTAKYSETNVVSPDNHSTFRLSGGTVSAKFLNFGGDSTSAAVNGCSGEGSASFIMSGGALYLGSSATAPSATPRSFDGIDVTGTGNFTSSIVLSGGTMGANADWTGAANMKLDTTNGPVTFQAGDANGVARNISITGTLSNNGSVNGGLNKTGSGTLTLDAVNTYTGPTNIKSGTLALGAGGSISNSGTINLGDFACQGNLDLSAKGSYNFEINQTLTGYGSVQIGAGKTVTISGIFAPGNGAGMVSIGGDLTLGSTAITVLELSGTGGVAGTDFDKVSIDGTFTYGGALCVLPLAAFNLDQEGAFQLFQFASESGSFNSILIGATNLSLNAGIWSGMNADSTYSYSFSENTGTLTVAAVPEPTTWAMLMGGFGMLLGLQRIRSKRIS